MIGNVLQADLQEMIRGKNWDELREAFSELAPPDIAEVLIDLPVEEEGVIFRVLPREQAGIVFSYLPLERQEELLHSLSNDQVRSILGQMTLGFGALLGQGLVLALYEWYRCAELTADRAALLCVQDMEPTRGAFMKMAGFTPDVAVFLSTPVVALLIGLLLVACFAAQAGRSSAALRLS